MEDDFGTVSNICGIKYKLTSNLSLKIWKRKLALEKKYWQVNNKLTSQKESHGSRYQPKKSASLKEQKGVLTNL
jgi:hypothetical protein